MNEVIVVRNVLAADQISALLAFRGAEHHQEEHGGHYDPGVFLPWVARALFPHLPTLRVGDRLAARVCENVKLYRLRDGAAVPVHTDVDFDADDGTRALYSVLVRLSDSYEGGETLFRGTQIECAVGDALVFPHALPHEGRAVRSGEKVMLKADLLFERA